ncbi:MAG TPA: amidase [Micromonosporaceae bacterium]
MAELHELSALELAAAIRTGELSAVEVVDHYLTRIAAYGEHLGAFVTVVEERARARAAEADAAVRRGDALPMLHGVPVAIKDLALTAGVRTTFGSKAFADYVPEHDADVVTALKAAGTICVGKTTTSEFGCSLYTEGLVAPPARNPWAPHLTAGGSSGGSAAAVAAGLVPLAHGSDGGGSLRTPAAICGVVGFKPSRGVVSTGPLGFGGFGLPTDGPLARSVVEAAALLDAMALRVPGQPYPPPPRPPGGYLAGALRGEPPPLRVGWFTTPMLVETDVDPACVTAVAHTVAALAEAGHAVTEIPPPFTPDMMASFQRIWAVLALSPVPPQREGDLLPLTRWLRTRGAAVDVQTLLVSLADLQSRVRHAAHAVADFDVLLFPVLSRAQEEVGYFTSTGDPAWDFAEQARFSPYNAPVNVMGGPALALPVGATADNLPVGVQLVAPPGKDALLLALGAQVEAVRPWTARHPALWRGEPSVTVDPNHGPSEVWGR